MKVAHTNTQYFTIRAGHAVGYHRSTDAVVDSTMNIFHWLTQILSEISLILKNPVSARLSLETVFGVQPVKKCKSKHMLFDKQKI